VALASLSQFDEAQRQIDAAVRAGPKFPEAHNFRGTLLERAGKHDAALAEFLEAIRLRPAFALAHKNAARVLAAKGDHAAAERHLRQAGDPAVHPNHQP
jgi:Flp pilus assembly protein TadD